MTDQKLISAINQTVNDLKSKFEDTMKGWDEQDFLKAADLERKQKNRKGMIALLYRAKRLKSLGAYRI